MGERSTHCGSTPNPRTRFRPLLRCLAHTLALLLTAAGTYLVARLIYVPTPIRIFRANAAPFREYVELIRKGEKPGMTQGLAPYELRISVDDTYVLFMFPNLPPEPVVLIGCRWRPIKDQHDHPSQILGDPKQGTRMTYRFAMLDSDWFYWEYDF